MELEADGTRLDVADPGEQQGRDDLAIAQATANPGAELLEDTIARRLFQQAHQRFDVGMEANGRRVQPGVGGGDRRQAGQKAQVTQAGECAGGRQLEKTSPLHVPSRIS